MKLQVGSNTHEYAYFLGQIQIARIWDRCDYSVSYQPVTHQEMRHSVVLVIPGGENQSFPNVDAAQKFLFAKAGDGCKSLTVKREQTSRSEELELPAAYIPQGEHASDWITADNGATFEGSRAQFADCFSSNATNASIAEWARKQKHLVRINGEVVQA